MPDPYRESTEEAPEAQSSGTPSMPANPVEQEILDLERQLLEKRAALGQNAEIAEKKLETVIGAEQTGLAAVAPAINAAPIAPEPAQVQSDIQQLKGVEKNQQIKALVDLAFQKGVAHATEVVRNLDSPYLIDEFHDTLIDEFRNKLVEAGKLEEI